MRKPNFIRIEVLGVMVYWMRGKVAIRGNYRGHAAARIRSTLNSYSSRARREGVDPINQERRHKFLDALSRGDSGVYITEHEFVSSVNTRDLNEQELFDNCGKELALITEADKIIKKFRDDARLKLSKQLQELGINIIKEKTVSPVETEITTDLASSAAAPFIKEATLIYHGATVWKIKATETQDSGDKPWLNLHVSFSNPEITSAVSALTMNILKEMIKAELHTWSCHNDKEPVKFKHVSNYKDVSIYIYTTGQHK